MKPQKSHFSITSVLAFAFGMCSLSACFDSPNEPDPDGLQPLDTEAYFIGDYTVSQDTIFMRLPSDTTWNCFGDGPGMEIDDPETDSTLFSISGNRLRLFDKLDTIPAYEDGEEMGSVVRRHTQFLRVGGGSRLEGRWQWEANGYEVFSGALNAESKAEMERSQELMRIQLQYIQIELELSQGKAWGRSKGNFAGLFQARWNGELEWDSLDRPDSARYNIEVKTIGQDTVRLKGNVTGEIVTLTFHNPYGYTNRYTSDNPDRIPYSDVEAYRDCNVDTWFDEFKSENGKAGEIFKKAP
jgi:hypothetical protein